MQARACREADASGTSFFIDVYLGEYCALSKHGYLILLSAHPSCEDPSQQVLATPTRTPAAPTLIILRTTNMSEYSKKTVAELQSILRSHGITPTGKKADLVARLEEYDASNSKEGT